MRIPVVLHLHQQLVLSDFFVVVNFSHSNRYIIVTHYCFTFQRPNDK